MSLLATRPIAELTVGEIAAEAKVGRSGFYVYFESKYAALAVITNDVWSELMIRADDYTRPSDESVADFVERTGRIAFALWTDHEAALIASIQAIPLDKQIATLWKTWNERLSQILTQQVLQDREEGLAQPASADVPELVTNLHEMTQHMFYLNRLNKYDEAQTERMFETVKAIWIASVWGRSAP